MNQREQEMLSKRDVFLQRIARGVEENLFSKAAIRRDAAITALIDTCMAVAGVLKTGSNGRFTLNPVNEGVVDGWVRTRIELCDTEGAVVELFVIKVSWNGQEIDVEGDDKNWHRCSGITLDRGDPSKDMILFREFFQDAVVFEHSSPLVQQIARRLSETKHGR